MKAIILTDLEVPNLGFYKKGEVEISNQEAEILSASPYVIINKQTNAHPKKRSNRNRR